MDYKTIRKSELTLTSLVVTMILAIAIFTGAFLYIQSQASENNAVVDSKYNTTYTKLVESQNSLDDNVNDIQNNLNEIKEADSVYAVAWNGLKGLGNTLKLPVNFVSRAIEITGALLVSGDIVPTWVKTLLWIGIIAVVVLLVLSILKGDPKV